MKKNALILSTLVFLATASVVFAADSTPTPTADLATIPVASTSAIKDDLNKRIKEAIDKNLKNTQSVLSKNANRNLLVGYDGTIGDIKQGVFSLTSDGLPIQISYSSDTTILKDNKPLKPEMISLKDRAIVIGNISSTDVLTAKRIVVYTPNVSVTPEKKVIFAPIVKIKGSTITLIIDGKNQDVVPGKNLKIDLKSLTTSSKIFGIIIGNIGLTSSPTLLQGKVI